jgi:Fur family transcriptional regulator, peroxide stress response regulator
MTQLRIIDPHRRDPDPRQRMAEFADRCRAAGLAVTPQRLAIIEALLASDDHPRAERIFADVRRQHPHISLATVHRTLETLCAIGEARKVTVLHDSARYDGNLEAHHHVICVRCRTIRDITLSGLGQIVDGNMTLEGFTPLGVALEVQALCDRCKQSRATGDDSFARVHPDRAPRRGGLGNSRSSKSTLAR